MPGDDMNARPAHPPDRGVHVARGVHVGHVVERAIGEVLLVEVRRIRGDEHDPVRRAHPDHELPRRVPWGKDEIDALHEFAVAVVHDDAPIYLGVAKPSEISFVDEGPNGEAT